MNFLEWLIEPAASIQKPERRRRARLLSALVIAQFFLSFISTFLIAISPHIPGHLYLTIGTTLLLVIAYFLSRTDHYNLAGLIAVSTFSGAIFTGEFLNQTPSAIPLYFLILGVLVSSLFLPRRDTMLITIATLIGLGLLSVYYPNLETIGPMFAVLCVGVLGIVGITIRQQDMEQIQEQSNLLLEDIARREQAEEAVRLSERRFRALIENSAGAIALIDPTGVAVYDSPAAPGMLGYGPDDWIGKNVFELVHPEDLPNIQAELQRLAITPGARVSGVTFRLHHKNGVWLWVEAIATNLLADPSVGAIVVNYHDITERKLAEEALRESEVKYRTLVEKMGEGVIVVDNHDVIQFVNDRFTQQVGYSREELLGKVAYELLLDQEDRSLLIEKNRTRTEHKSDEYEIRMKTKSGEWIWMRISGAPVVDRQGNVIGSIGINTDITERKRSDEELKRRLADFEAVNRLSTAMREAQNLSQLLDIVVDTVLEMLDTTRGSLWLYDKNHGELRSVVVRGNDREGKPIVFPSERPGEKIAGRVFSTREVMIVEDLHTTPYLPESLRERIPAGLGLVAVPLRAADHLIGALSISVFHPRKLTDDEIHLLKTLGEIAGNAIQRSSLHEQTERHLHHLVALSEIDKAIASSFDLRMSLGVLVNHVITELDIDAADVLLFDSNSLIFERVAAHGFRNKSATYAQPRLDKGYAGQAILERQMVKIANIAEQHEDALLTTLGAQEGFVSYYAMPLMAKGYTKGVLEIFSRSQLEPNEDWLSFLSTLGGQAAIAIDNATLFEGLEHSNAELLMAYDATIEGWSHALDLRDKETEGHTQRVTDMTLLLARAFDLSEAELAQVRWGALLHDIGKMGVPDAILHKAGPLTDEEWVLMKKHPRFAYEMLSPIRYLRSALDIPYCHHEKWDGTGYPRGLKGEHIPLTARIFAVVDVWDALRSDRPYRAGWPEDVVLEYIKSLSGTHFDPKVVEVFLSIMEK